MFNIAYQRYSPKPGQYMQSRNAQQIQNSNPQPQSQMQNRNQGQQAQLGSSAQQAQHTQQPLQRKTPQPGQQRQNKNPRQQYHGNVQQTPPPRPHTERPKRHIRKGGNQQRQAPKANGFLTRFLPTSIYNPDTKKILGILSAEDLLLVALIFLFLDSDNEDSNLMVLALAFVLLSDYIDLSQFSL